MIGESSEGLQSSGIVLIGAGENFAGLSDRFFHGQDKLIPSIGKVYLFGTRDYEYTNDQTGIAFDGNAITMDKAQALQAKGLFDTEVIIRGLYKPEISLACNLLIPQQGIFLEAKFDQFDVDEVETDRLEKYTAFADFWRRPSDDIPYRFFFTCKY